MLLCLQRLFSASHAASALVWACYSRIILLPVVTLLKLSVAVLPCLFEQPVSQLA